MESDIEQKIDDAGNNSDFYNTIYVEILNSDLEVNKKEKLLGKLKKKSFDNGLDFTHFSIPKTKGRKKTKKDNAFKETIDLIVDSTEREFISEQLEIIKSNFPFLKPIVIKRGVQVDSFKSTVICCDQISTDYLNTYFSDHRYISCSDFLPNLLENENSYVFVLIWPSDKRNSDLLEKLKSIKGSFFFDTVAFNRNDFYWRQSADYLFDDIQDYLELKYDEQPLLNADLNIDQEHLIRLAIGSPTGFLTYRLITGGYTGALVLELASVGNGNARKKFVLKIDRIDREFTTISEEYKNFLHYVDGLSVEGGRDLSAKHFKSGNFEAIRYPFASDDSTGGSVSFGEYFLDMANSQSDVKDVLENVFSDSLMKNWNSTFSVKEISLFGAFKKLDWKIEDFARIEEFRQKFTYAEDLDLKKMSDFFNGQFNVVFATAHGDLHVENIRVDSKSKQIFFIDFGRTGQEPLGIDYAQLECSLRFRMLDKAFPISDLDICDNKYFEYFAEILDGEKGEIHKTLYAVSLIRQHYINNFPIQYRADAERQYYFCLFAVACWLIDKKNLNRLYIWRILRRLSGLLLGK